MEMKDIVTTAREEKIIYHMNEILKAVSEIQPDHGILSISVNDGYYSLMCGGDGIFDKMNFSLHINDENPFLMRSHGEGNQSFESVEIDDIDKYLADAKEARNRTITVTV